MKNSEAILVTPKHFEIQECPVPEPKDHETVSYESRVCRNVRI